MVTTHEVRGSKEEIVAEIGRVKGRIVSAILVVEGEPAHGGHEMNAADEAAIRAEMESDAVAAPHADDSRDAIYSRMPGE